MKIKFDKPTLVTITAPTCSGKNYLLDHLLDLGYTKIVGTTTREPREGEISGLDYHFISRERSLEIEANGGFAEVVEFRGNRYGVTQFEMEEKLLSDKSPVIILEIEGLAQYEKLCVENGWDIFKVFISVPEATKLKRLNQRTADDIRGAIKAFDNKHLDCFGVTVYHDRFTTVEPTAIDKIIDTHTSRLQSITGDERLWQTRNTWDAIVPGDDINKALSYIEQGIKCRNSPKGVVTT